MATFSERLVQLRKENDYTQIQLAEKLHLSKGAIGNYEKGVRIPALEGLEAIADLFNVEIDYLIGRTNDRPEYSLEEMWIIDCYRRCDLPPVKKAIKELLRPYDKDEKKAVSEQETASALVS